MAYKIVEVKNRVIHSPDNTPMQGYWITARDDATGDVFSFESTSTDPLVVEPTIRVLIAQRKALGGMSFE